MEFLFIVPRNIYKNKFHHLQYITNSDNGNNVAQHN